MTTSGLSSVPTSRSGSRPPQMPAIITWSTGAYSGAVASNKRDAAARVRGGPIPMWMAVTAELPTRPVQGAPLTSLVGLRPNAVVMASISSGMGASTTTRRSVDNFARLQDRSDRGVVGNIREDRARALGGHGRLHRVQRVEL